MKRIFETLLLLQISLFSFGQVRINEFLATNINGMYDPDFGEFSDWIELHNYGTSAVDISGWWLTDDTLNVKKWQFPASSSIPAKGYVVVYADDHNTYPGQQAVVIYTTATTITVKEYHTNFGISAKGEVLTLSDASGNVMDKVKFMEQFPDVSYGRDPQDTDTWLHWGTPTPAKENKGNPADKAQFVAKPEIVGQGGVSLSSVDVQLTCQQTSAVIHYTIDGSYPTEQSPTYTGTITSDTSIVVRAIAYADGYLPSPVASRSFIVDNKHDLPVICITTENRHLWASDFGVYQNGLKDREVPIHIEMYDTAGKQAFSVNAGMALFGSMIFQLPQKPMGIYLKNKYGDEAIDYKLFKNKDITHFESFILRNGGNDYNLTMFRDAMVATTVSGEMDIDYMEYQPAAVYLNGKYWGLYNIREKQNDSYLEQNHNISTSKLDILEDSLLVNNGNEVFYKELLKYIRTADPSKPEFLTGAQKLMDVDNYINMMTAKIYGGYYIWFMNNKYWAERKPGGRWRWFLFDMEHTFAGPSGDGYMENTLQKTLQYPNPIQPEWSTELFRVLMSNKQFRDRFVQTFALHANTTFTATRVNGIIDSLKANIYREMERHIARWSTPGSMFEWENHVAQMSQFATERPNNIFTHFITALKLAGTVKVTMNSNLSQGAILFNDTRIKQSQLSAKIFKNIPFALKAVANPGYKFVRFEGLNGESPDSIKATANMTITAVFEDDSINLLPDTVRGTLIIENNGRPYTSKGDLVIPSGDTLIVKEGVTIQMYPGSSILDYGYLQIKGTAQKNVIIEANQNPANAIPGKDYTWGALCARSSTDSLIVEYAMISNATHGTRAGEEEMSAINIGGGNVRIDHVTITDAVNPIHCQQAGVIIRNCYLKSGYTCDILNIYNCTDIVVENNEIVGSPAEDADAMDLGFLTRGIVRNNKIYGFTGFNSDGVDLGEACDSVLIEGNYIYGNDDKGVSIGGGSIGVLKQNVIVECGKGVGVKDSVSVGYITNNTFFGCGVALACYEKKEGRGGGRTIVENTIISKSKIADMYIDPLSRSSISYSLSDNEMLPGTNNIKSNPKFVSVTMRDFNLLASSPCIDKGNPLSPNDGDGSRADIGARFKYVADTVNTITVNEIFYASKDNMNTGDWIELYNYGQRPVDLSYWTLYDSNNDAAFELPINSIVEAGERVVIADKVDSLAKYQPSWNGKNLCKLTFGLSEKGDEVHLLNQQMMPVFDVIYNNKNNWAWEPSKAGNSLERFEDIPTQSSRDWYASHVFGGTPGEQNSVATPAGNLTINEVIPSQTSSVAQRGIEIFNNDNKILSLRDLYLTNNRNIPCMQYISLDSQIDSLQPAWFAFLESKPRVTPDTFGLVFEPVAFTGFVGLVQIAGRDTIWIDSLSYSIPRNSFTFGRYPDGSDYLGFMNPTIAQSNSGLIDLSSNANPDISTSVYPIPCHDILTIVSPDEIENITITDESGRSVLSVNKQETIDINRFSNGFYIVEITLQKGKTTKLIVKE